MILAVQIFNSSAMKFKTEVFGVLANVAWRYLKHDYCLRKTAVRVKNAETTKNRMQARVMNGYWVFQKPPGYA